MEAGTFSSISWWAITPCWWTRASRKRLRRSSSLTWIRSSSAPERLTLAVTTHADLDHQGGNDAIKRTSPGTWLSCGAADRALVEDPRALYDIRYNFLRADHDMGFDPDPPPDAGKARKMDLCFTGGEVIRLT